MSPCSEFLFDGVSEMSNCCFMVGRVWFVFDSESVANPIHVAVLVGLSVGRRNATLQFLTVRRATVRYIRGERPIMPPRARVKRNRKTSSTSRSVSVFVQGVSPLFLDVQHERLPHS